MLFDELVRGMSEDESTKKYFNGTEVAGSGNRSTKTVSSGTTVRISSEAARDPARYKQAREQASKEGKSLLVED
jgi:hypothetical protein